MNHFSGNDLFINIHFWKLLKLVWNIERKILLCKWGSKMTPLTMTITNPNTPTFLDRSKVLDDEEWVLVRFEFTFYVNSCLGNMWDFLDDVFWFMNVQLVHFNSSDLGHRCLCCYLSLIIQFINWRRSCISMKYVSRISNYLVSFSLLSCLRFNHCFWFLFDKLIQNNFFCRRPVNFFDDLITVILDFGVLKNLNFKICRSFCDLL